MGGMFEAAKEILRWREVACRKATESITLEQVSSSLVACVAYERHVTFEFLHKNCLDDGYVMISYFVNHLNMCQSGLVKTEQTATCLRTKARWMGYKPRYTLLYET